MSKKSGIVYLLIIAIRLSAALAIRLSAASAAAEVRFYITVDLLFHERSLAEAVQSI